MTHQELSNILLDNLIGTKLPTDFDLDLRGYSSRYSGRYSPRDKKIILYCLDEDNEILPIKDLTLTLIHEAVHHYQWSHDPNFVRVKGVMHNAKFKLMEEYCIDKYVKGVKYEKIKTVLKAVPTKVHELSV